MNVEAGKAIVVAKAALFALYVEYAEGRGFNMDKYTSVEKSLDDAFEASGFARRTRIYPNPCNEILIGRSRVR